MGERSGQLDKEREFHDRWASTMDVETMPVQRFFEGSTAPENRFIVRHMGDVRGKRVLDLGCGAGEASVYFAQKGARCVAADCSPGMLETAKALARAHGVAIDTHVIDAAEIGFDDDTFDFVYAGNLLHHVEARQTLREMHRVVKPGGKVCFWDPLKHNPLINVYRRMAKEVRTEDEKPLSIHIVRFVRSLFADVDYETFWILTLWIFLRFYLIEKVDPNKERYWRKIIYEEERLRARYLRLEKLDRLVKKIPFARRFAWNIAVVATK